MYLLRNELFQQFYGKVFLFHLCHIFKEFRVEQREFLFHIGEKIDYSVALYAVLQQFVDTSVHFGEGDFLISTLI